ETRAAAQTRSTVKAWIPPWAMQARPALTSAARRSSPLMRVKRGALSFLSMPVPRPRRRPEWRLHRPDQAPPEPCRGSPTGGKAPKVHPGIPGRHGRLKEEDGED